MQNPVQADRDHRLIAVSLQAFSKYLIRSLQLCDERDISINRLAAICALPPSSIKNILYGKSQNPKLLTIKMICDGLDITLGEFFSTPEFDSLEQEIK